MSTSAPQSRPTSAPTPERDGGPSATLADGRYVLGACVSGDAVAGLWSADDTRLGRAVLIRCDERQGQAGPPSRLPAIDHPAVAPVLDAGVVGDRSGVQRSWTVFPASDWLPFDALPGADLAAVAPTSIAAAAAWLVAATVHTQSVQGGTVALSSDAVLLDLRWLAGALPADGCPVRWMPGPGPADGLVTAVGRLATAAAGRSDRRRWADALASIEVLHGRRRAVRLLAAMAGLDPLVLGLTPLAPHHAGRERRSFGRRSPGGTVPTTKRSETPCVSVEACS